MNEMLAQIETGMRAADYISQQSVGWIVIALLVSIATIVGGIIRYLLKREDTRDKHDALRAEREERFAEVRMSAIIENNRLMREVSEIMHRVNQKMTK